VEAETRLARAFERRQPGPLTSVTARLRALPDFLVIGAQKSGTTSIWQYLSAHPSVRFGRIKEVHYFDLSHHFGERWYRAQFPLRMIGSRGRLVGDASPYYLFHPHAPRRAAALVPDAKLVAILRNPVDRAFSHYNHVVARGHEMLPFEAALEREAQVMPAEVRRLVDDPAYRSLAHERYSYVSRGEYAGQLERWLASYPRERLHVIASERLFEDPNTVMAELHEFLGLAGRDVVSPGRFKVGRYEDQLLPETRARLVDHFRPHNAALESLLGMRFDWDR
jgi:hypothetical protein